MPKCETCGSETELPHVCCYCQKPFCTDHLSPEAHNCRYLALITELEVTRNGHRAPGFSSPRRLVALLFLSIILLSPVAVYAFAGPQIDYEKYAVNPTYREALDFVTSDHTDRNQYVVGKYMCGDFARDFRYNALRSGYRCGFVVVQFASRVAHALDCFNTTDQGLTFVEPQLGVIVKVAIGRMYWNQITLLSPNYNDTIVDFLIVW